jgi:hypothetical protein
MIAADGKIVTGSTTFAPTTEPGKSYLVSSVALGSGEASSYRVVSSHVSPRHIRTPSQFTNFDGKYSNVFISIVTLSII